MPNHAYPYKPRPTNARIAGFVLLVYIAVQIASLLLFNGASGAEGTSARLAAIAQHVADVRVSALLGLLSPFIAIVLSTALYAIARDQDRFISMVAMVLLFGAGVVDSIFIPTTLGLLSLATSPAAATSAGYALGSFLLTAGTWNPIIAATFFAVGFTLFTWLLLRGRMVPAAFGTFGVLASALWVIALPLQLTGILPGSVALPIYAPMVVFGISLGLWLLVKGIALPTPAPASPAKRPTPSALPSANPTHS